MDAAAYEGRDQALIGVHREVRQHRDEAPRSENRGAASESVAVPPLIESAATLQRRQDAAFAVLLAAHSKQQNGGSVWVPWSELVAAGVTKAEFSYLSERRLIDAGYNSPRGVDGFGKDEHLSLRLNAAGVEEAMRRSHLLAADLLKRDDSSASAPQRRNNVSRWLLPPDFRPKLVATAKELLNNPAVADSLRVQSGVSLLRLIGQSEMPGKEELPCPIEHQETLDAWRAMHDPMQRLAALAESKGIDSTPLREAYGARYFTELVQLEKLLDRLEVIERVVAAGADLSPSRGSASEQPPPPGRRRGMRRDKKADDDAVRDYINKLRSEGTPDERITRDQVSGGTGIPAGSVSGTKAWTNFRAAKRAAGAKPPPGGDVVEDPTKALIESGDLDAAVEAVDWKAVKELQAKEEKKRRA